MSFYFLDLRDFFPLDFFAARWFLLFCLNREDRRRPAAGCGDGDGDGDGIGEVEASRSDGWATNSADLASCSARSSRLIVFWGVTGLTVAVLVEMKGPREGAGICERGGVNLRLVDSISTMISNQIVT